MPRNWHRVLFWTPRALLIFFILFISLFALDVFGEGYGIWGTLVALFMHLLPTWFMLALLAVSWRWEWLTAAGLIGFAVWYVASMWGRFPWSVYVLIAGIPCAIGLLFLADWYTRGHPQPAAL
ncbi:MAG: hypothetical protein U0822_25850 [Anaerolineae bacterium]